jgi:Spy/CpxP family protein refolding chaperone
MYRTFRTLVLVALTAAAVPATLALAAPNAAPTHGPAAHGRGPGGHLLRMADELGLSEAQRTKIKGILEQHRPAFHQFRADMRAALQKLEGAIEAGADDATIAGFAVDAYEVKQEMKAYGAKVKKEVGAVLTPEQKERLKQLREERKAARDGAGDLGDDLAPSFDL